MSTRADCSGALGPLTNLALALRLDPDPAARIGRLVVMGGAVTGHGNMTTIPAEFNIALRPRGRARGVRVGLPAEADVELVDWEAVLRHGFAARRRSTAGCRQATPARASTRRFSRHTRELGRAAAAAGAGFAPMPWPWPLALDPAGVAGGAGRGTLAVELAGRHTAGATVVDWERRSGRPANARIVLAYDQRRFEALVRVGAGAPERRGIALAPAGRPATMPLFSSRMTGGAQP